MIIKKVPEINGPNFGGVIYGLNLKHGYSTSPSELTINIISRDGKYNISSSDLNRPQTVRFGGFTFTGFIWEYKINTSAEEATLEVKLLDGSIILDRYWVLLWKRGLLNNLGKSENENVRFEFDESILIPAFNNKGRVIFREQGLRPESVNIPYRSFAGRNGNILLVGTEQIPNSSCEIPTTDYNFNEFASICPVSTAGLEIDKEYRATYEGRLRDVLNSWCEAAGYSFYWDFSNNSIQYYDSSRGFSSSLPNVESANIISKEESYSLKGTFKQFAISWAGKPREPLKTLSSNATIQDSFKVVPLPLDFFAGKEARKQSILSKSARWGKGRGRDGFIKSAVLGTINSDLRILWNILDNNLSLIGVEGDKIGDAKKLTDFLKAKGYQAIDELKEISPNLQDYDVIVGSYNPDYAETWNSIEQNVISKIGSYYRIGIKSAVFYFCDDTSFTTVNIKVDPEGTEDEELGSDFYGAKIFNRGGGGIVPGSNVALEELKFEEKNIAGIIDSLKPRIFLAKESGLYDTLISNKIIKENQDNKSPAVMFIPKEELIKKLLKLDVDTESSTHPTESTIRDIRAQAQENKEETCDEFEETKDAGSCKSYEDIARERSLRNAVKKKEKEELYSGLENADCKAIKISVASGGRTRVYLPSESAYQVVITAETQYEKISDLSLAEEQELLYSNGTTGTADDVEQIEVLLSNVTDSKFEKFRSSKRKNGLPTARNINATQPLSRISYVFVGEPTITNLTPSNGIESLDVSLSSDGFKTTVSFANRAPKRGTIDSIMDKVNSQFRRNAYNGG